MISKSAFLIAILACAFVTVNFHVVPTNAEEIAVEVDLNRLSDKIYNQVYIAKYADCNIKKTEICPSCGREKLPEYCNFEQVAKSEEISVFMASNDTSVLVAFRGNDGLDADKSWSTAAVPVLVNFTSANILVERRSFRMFQKIVTQMRKACMERINSNQARPTGMKNIYFTGRRVGGQMARLAALDIVMNVKYPASSVSVVTVDSPYSLFMHTTARLPKFDTHISLYKCGERRQAANWQLLPRVGSEYWLCHSRVFRILKKASSAPPSIPISALCKDCPEVLSSVLDKKAYTAAKYWFSTCTTPIKREMKDCYERFVAYKDDGISTGVVRGCHSDYVVAPFAPI